MSTLNFPQTTLINTVWNTRGFSSRLTKNLILAITGSLAIWISAKIQIPFYPVPITMQTLVVLMIGMVYGYKLGVSTLLLYLLEGAAGLPVFAGTPAKGIGFAYMLGTTGGYLIGFVFAVAIIGWLASRGWDRHPIKTAAAMIIGNLVIYSFGIAWLASLVGWDKPVLEWGLVPFLLGDIFKIILAAIFLPLVWKKIGKRSLGNS